MLSCLHLHAQQTLVEDVRIRGNRRIPAETVKARIFTRPGDVYDPQAIERDFNSLWNTGYYDDLRFERQETPKGVIIYIYVTEKPTIREIKYTGLNSVSQSDVLDRFKKEKVGLTQESQYDPTKVKKAEVVLKSLLGEHGRQFATIRTEVRRIPPAAVSIDFVVKEGPKVKVGKISFDGNKKIPSRELRAAMKNTKPIGIPHSLILENLFSRTYDASKLDEDAERVRFFYQTKGYFKVLVDDPKTKIRDTSPGFPYLFRHSGKVVDIRVPIQEGDRYRLGKIDFKNVKQNFNVKALRAQFPIKDGDIFNRESIAKGLENLRKAYGELGFINFSAVPETTVDEDKKTVSLDVDIDEGKQFFVRRIEFTGNTTTRDKVIRRELALEEGNVYNSKLWEFSLLRLNQLNYFEPLKEEQDSEAKQNVQDGTVDLTLKVKEKGKNSIGLQGGVSGLAGSFIGINYETNNFLGLGETLTVSANLGNLQRSILFGFTEPYAFDRPLQLGFTLYTSRYDYNAAKNYSILTGTNVNLPSDVLNTLQNFSQSQTGFTVSSSYPIRRSLKRVGLSYSYQRSSVQTFSTASQQYFEAINFDGVSGPNSLRGIITSKLTPSFTFNSIDSPYQPHRGTSLFVGGEFAGVGGNVNTIRPIVELKHWIPVNKRRNSLGFRVTGSFITGYAGKVAPPYERFYMGGENDLRGFDIRTVTPYVFIANRVTVPLQNPDGSLVPLDPTNPRRGAVQIPIPAETIIYAGGDTTVNTNIEYRIPIVTHVTLAAFNDFGMNFIALPNQLKLTPENLANLNGTPFGCPSVDVSFNCQGARTINFSPTLQPIPGTNYTPRMSTGMELQVLLPIVNAPFRIYYAYNPLLLNTNIPTKSPITRDMFPAGAAGDYTYQRSLILYGSTYVLREPKKTFRFTVSTTF
ncbi:MAG: outer membrane protein assembly factor BamA [Acidobacteria bacterium]|nr:MAG: outer membrane protein assembly factor BamA [Acidobacteriota bacterium]